MADTKYGVLGLFWGAKTLYIAWSSPLYIIIYNVTKGNFNAND